MTRAHGLQRGPPPQPLLRLGIQAGEGSHGTAQPNVPEVPLRASDHALDATRYALHTELGRLAEPRGRAEAGLLLWVQPNPRVACI
jgi:hypothetical protein